jgi:hypothetical protein
MRLLEFSDLDISGLKESYQKVRQHLADGNFAAAQAKKLKNTNFYRCKLDHSNRLLFKIMRYKNEKCILLLETIHNHNYERSRFIYGGANVEEEQILELKNEQLEELPYLHEGNSRFHVLNKFLSFDDIQSNVFPLHPPLIIVGSAGSGKTMLTLEKLKQLSGEVLYVSQSGFLTEMARNIYFSMNYQNEHQEIDFLSYRELLETIKIPEGKSINYKIFSEWAKKQATKFTGDTNKLFEEFKGVLTGSLVNSAYLSREDYLALGVKQSIFLEDEKEAVYTLFERYQQFMKDNDLHDENMLSFDYLALIKPRYDYVLIDEVQDLTNIQITLILSLLREPTHFILCGDANQIVHPNFFSWSKVKSLFYEAKTKSPTEIIRVLYRNYRNSRSVNEIANTILKIKNLRFGSIDRESHYLMETRSTLNGEVNCIPTEERGLLDLNRKTKLSTQTAVIVLEDDHKLKAKQFFDTPLIFSVREAKGLEYDTIILFQLIESEKDRYREIATSINASDLLSDDLRYARAKDKADKSLEIYKFYINALYVACTRAIQNIIFVEPSDQHVIFKHLNIKFGKPLILAESRSSLEDWQREAHRLEQQGKHDQAADIREKILKIHEVPWKVYDSKKIAALHEQLITNLATVSKDEKIALVECAIVYDDIDILTHLAALGVNAARNIKKSHGIIDEKYFAPYRFKNTSSIHRNIEKYGVNFRNLFNQTPLMLAAQEANVTLLQELNNLGADQALIENKGRNAYQLALMRALTGLDKKFHEGFAQVYSLLCPSHIIVEYQKSMKKIDNRLMEFFMLNVMLILLPSKQKERRVENRLFSTQDFCEKLAALPSSILPDNRKKRAYISSILSKNEVNRVGDYNRKLFLRIARGYYIIHPELAIKINDEWINAYSLVNAENSNFSQ